MRWPRMRLTVFRLLLVVAVSAILLHLATDSLRSRAREHYDRCMRIADYHASTAAVFRRNARGDARMLEMAALNERIRGEFERAAQRPQEPLPQP